MTTLSELPTQKLKEYIDASGYTAGFIDVDGNSQPALEFQIEAFDETVMYSDKRYLIYIDDNSTSPYPSLTDERTMTIHLMGLEGQPPFEQLILKGLARDLRQYIIDNPRANDQGIYHASPITGISGPFKTKENRYVYRLTLNVRFC